PKETFCCQDYTKLLIAGARDTGLKAFYTHLERDYAGKIVYHDCAVIFAGGEALLVDPAYHWFGAPHKQFVVLDDIQAIAHHLYQGPNGSNRLAEAKVAVKLHPDTAWGRIILARAFLAQNYSSEAETELRKSQEIEPGRWDSCFLQGQIA